MSRRTVVHLVALTVVLCTNVSDWGDAARAQSSAGIQFLPIGTPGSNTVYLTGVGEDSADGLLTVEIRANDVTDLYGVSFTLQFPTKLLRFPESRPTVITEGSFLNEEGAAETILLVEQQGKNVIVGLTRKGQVDGVSGSGLLLTLEFRGLGVAGRKVFRLRQTDAADSAAAVIDDFTWLAGKIVITTE